MFTSLFICSYLHISITALLHPMSPAGSPFPPAKWERSGRPMRAERMGQGEPQGQVTQLRRHPGGKARASRTGACSTPTSLRKRQAQAPRGFTSPGRPAPPSPALRPEPQTAAPGAPGRSRPRWGARGAGQAPRDQPTKTLASGESGAQRHLPVGARASALRCCPRRPAGRAGAGTGPQVGGRAMGQRRGAGVGAVPGLGGGGEPSAALRPGCPGDLRTSARPSPRQGSP